jgi:hypothetical protein
MMMAKAQDRYANAVNKKRREESFKEGEKVWLDSTNLGLPTEVSAKWFARWIGPFPVKKILHPDVYVSDLQGVGKNWHPVYHVSMLKKCYRDDKQLHLWQEDPRPPKEYELWDGNVGKVTAIIDSQQIFRRGKQYKCLIHGYTPFEYEWINAANLPHAKLLIKEFEARKKLEATAAKTAKAKGKSKKTSTQPQTLIDDHDIDIDKDGHPRQPDLDVDSKVRLKVSRPKRRKKDHIHPKR